MIKFVSGMLDKTKYTQGFGLDKCVFLLLSMRENQQNLKKMKLN